MRFLSLMLGNLTYFCVFKYNVVNLRQVQYRGEVLEVKRRVKA